MTLATPIILGPWGTPVRDAGTGGNATPTVYMTSGNATPCVLVASGPGLAITLPTITTDAATTAWVNAVIANGGSVSTLQQFRVNMLITQLKAAGAWTAMDDAWLLVSESAIQALTSLKQLRLAVATNSPVFTAGQGYAFDGATNFINTGFIPITHAVSMTASNNRASVYEGTNVSATTAAAGVTQATSRVIVIIPQATSPAFALLSANVTGGTFALPVADSRGLISVSRNGPDATTVAAYKNGVALVRTADPTGFGATLPTNAIYIGGRNAAGVLQVPRAATERWVSIGASLTAAQEMGEFLAVQTYMSSWGANA